MAKYDVKYKCGHTVIEQLYGKQDERYRKIEWAKDNKLYGDCYQASLQAKRIAENAKAAEAAQEAGMPELKGSEKQVAWAITLRQKALGAIAPYISKAQGEDKIKVEKIIDFLKTQTDSKFWIDNRGGNFAAIAAKNTGVIA
jgi:hypothetical protein